MNSNDYIKKYIKEEYDLNFNQDLERDIIIYESYINSLKLFRSPEIIEIFNCLLVEKIIYTSLFRGDFPKHRIVRAIDKLLVDDLIEITEVSDDFRNSTIIICGRINIDKITYYTISKKGKDLISNKKIKRLLKWE